MGIGFDLLPEEAQRKPHPSNPHHAELLTAWKRLCCDMISRAALTATVGFRQADLGSPEERRYAREVAIRWIDGGVGVVTFEEACSGAGVSSSYARMKLKTFIQDGKRCNHVQKRRLASFD